MLKGILTGILIAILSGCVCTAGHSQVQDFELGYWREWKLPRDYILMFGSAPPALMNEAGLGLTPEQIKNIAQLAKEFLEENDLILQQAAMAANIAGEIGGENAWLKEIENGRKENAQLAADYFSRINSILLPHQRTLAVQLALRRELMAIDASEFSLPSSLASVLELSAEAKAGLDKAIEAATIQFREEEASSRAEAAKRIEASLPARAISPLYHLVGEKWWECLPNQGGISRDGG